MKLSQFKQDAAPVMVISFPNKPGYKCCSFLPKATLPRMQERFKNMTSLRPSISKKGEDNLHNTSTCLLPGRPRTPEWSSQSQHSSYERVTTTIALSRTCLSARPTTIWPSDLNPNTEGTPMTPTMSKSSHLFKTCLQNLSSIVDSMITDRIELVAIRRADI